MAKGVKSEWLTLMNAAAVLVEIVCLKYRMLPLLGERNMATSTSTSTPFITVHTL